MGFKVLSPCLKYVHFLLQSQGDAPLQIIHKPEQKDHQSQLQGTMSTVHFATCFGLSVSDHQAKVKSI